MCSGTQHDTQLLQYDVVHYMVNIYYHPYTIYVEILDKIHLDFLLFYMDHYL